MKRMKLMAFLLALLPAASFAVMGFWKGVISANVVDTFYAAYLPSFLCSIILFILARKHQTNFDFITLLLLLLASLPLILLLVLFIAVYICGESLVPQF